jgi:hypothetical protein
MNAILAMVMRAAVISQGSLVLDQIPQIFKSEESLKNRIRSEYTAGQVLATISRALLSFMIPAIATER